MTGAGLRPEEHRATFSSGPFDGLFVDAENAAQVRDVAREWWPPESS